MNHLEILCRPLLLTICENYCAAKAGAPVNAQKLQDTIRRQLHDIQLQSEEDPQLKRDYARIEKALIFFVDYTIKEGHFPFSDNWLEIARSYNELSGDEKFFDLLAETLDDPDASSRIQLLHLLMGLGFDGVYKQSLDLLERKMRLCATRFDQPAALDVGNLYSQDPVEKHPEAKKQKAVYPLLIVTLLCLVLSFAYNYHRFNRMTLKYRTNLNSATDQAVKLMESPTENHLDKKKKSAAPLLPTVNVPEKKSSDTHAKTAQSDIKYKTDSVSIHHTNTKVRPAPHAKAELEAKVKTSEQKGGNKK